MAETLPDDLHDSRQRPQLGDVAESFRAALQIRLQFDAVQGLQSGFAPGSPWMFQRGLAAMLPGGMPAPDGLVGHPAATGHLGLGTTLLEEFDSLHSSPFQRGEVSFHTFWITHATSTAPE